MKIKLIIFLGICISLLITSVLLVNVMENNEIKEGESEGVYQGPVPEGYDEDYFRKTGITKPLEDNN